MDTPSQHPFDWNAKLVRFFLNNTRLVWLLIISITIGGVVSLLSLRREGFPAVSPKMIVVQTVYPGASAEEMERQVTGAVENAVKDVKGRKETSSTSANSFSNVVVTLEPSANLEAATQDVQSKVQSARAELPSGAEAPKVVTFNTGGAAFVYGVTNPSGDMETIRQDAESIVTALSDVDGVKSVSISNASEKRVSVKFRPADLTANGVALQTLQLALQGANVNYPLGQAAIDDRSQSLVTIGAFGSLEDIKALVVGVNPRTFKPVTVADVAEVTLGYAESTVVNRFGYHRDGKLVSVPGVMLNIDITSTADIIKTRDAIREHLNEAKTNGSIASTADVVALSDQAQSTSEQITEILNAAIGSKSNLWLLGGLQLLFIALLIFVNWRAALVTSLSIPLSFLFTFLSLALTGVQLNTIVLFSMILVLGLIVDPAIVMIEAIQRFRDLKYKPTEAVLESGRRYGSSLFLAVLTSMIVFVPFGVVGGFFGQIIKYIPLTVLPALFASYLVPIALLPMLSKYTLAAHKDTHEHDGKVHEVEGLSSAAEWFMRLNRRILSRRSAKIGTLVAGFVLVGLSMSLVATGKIQTVQFAKPQDSPYLGANVTFTKGLTLAQRDATTASIEQLLLQEPRVDSYEFWSQNADGVFVYINLSPKKDFASHDDGSKQILARLKTAIPALTNISDVIVNEQGVGTPDPDFQISAQVSGDTTEILQHAAEDIGAFLRQQSKVVKVDDGFTGRGEPQLQIVLDRTKVAKAGISSFEIGQQLKAIVDETKVTKYTGAQGPSDVYLVNASKPMSEDDIAFLPLVTRSGATIRVRDVATISTTSAVDAISRLNGSRFTTIQARIDGTNIDVQKVQTALNEYLSDTKLHELQIAKTTSNGLLDEIASSFTQLGTALAIAVLLTYVVLVLQFKSFSQPLVMLVTIPLSFIGVFPALWAAKTDLGFLELLGVTILVGIVENVAIFLIDYANQLVTEQGVTPTEAIIRATGVRFRPIILTKLVALGGLLPLAIESEFWRGLALVIIAGIGLSGFLSLIIIPILYTWIEGGRTKFHRRFAHK